MAPNPDATGLELTWQNTSREEVEVRGRFPPSSFTVQCSLCKVIYSARKHFGHVVAWLAWLSDASSLCTHILPYIRIWRAHNRHTVHTHTKSAAGVRSMIDKHELRQMPPHSITDRDHSLLCHLRRSRMRKFMLPRRRRCSFTCISTIHKTRSAITASEIHEWECRNVCVHAAGGPRERHKTALQDFQGDGRAGGTRLRDVPWIF